MSLPPDYSAPADLLTGRNILITGAGDGIGRALASACAEHGATTLLLGRTTAKLESVYDEIVDAGNPEPGLKPIDLTHLDAARNLTLIHN